MLFLSCNANSGNPIVVSDAWIREVPVNSDVSALYFEVKNSGDGEDWIVSIDTPLSQKAEIHNTLIDSNGSATMVRLEDVKIASGESLKLSPGGMHVMLIGLKENIRAGQEYTVNINFKNSGNEKVTAKVIGLEETMSNHLNH